MMIIFYILIGVWLGIGTLLGLFMMILAVANRGPAWAFFFGYTWPWILIAGMIKGPFQYPKQTFTPGYPSDEETLHPLERCQDCGKFRNYDHKCP